ncbi:uncharacterized protein LOC111406516 [Olea europaea var. sylvestris]|uniref:uncharacterized protein LOC111406516 n=1 Tax=Olea europaea var. sylvestris TaxID=158386 RepID=UPI000C1D4371|nr:uncharacterized protein LOC111406516 [Olea europaea var. sylvestris]
MSPPVVATSSRSDKGKSSRMDESLVASLAEGVPSSTIVDEDADRIVRSIQDLFASWGQVQMPRPAPSGCPAASSEDDLKFLKEARMTAKKRNASQGIEQTKSLVEQYKKLEDL